MSTPATPQPQPTLQDFEEFMNTEKWGSGWALLDRRADLLRYEKSIAGSSGSCVVAALLLLLGLLPGILYLVFSRRPARTLRLTLTVRRDGRLAPTGDPEAIAKFEQFLDPKKTDKAALRQLRTNAVLIVVAALAMAWLASLLGARG
jgi:hypothetical protein